MSFFVCSSLVVCRVCCPTWGGEEGGEGGKGRREVRGGERRGGEGRRGDEEGGEEMKREVRR